jgi:copper chaperone CopZ
MKKTIAAIGFLFAASGAVAFAGEKTDTIKVTGWHCGGCADKTEAFLKKLDGVKGVNANKDRNEVKVTYDDAKVNHAQLEKAIADAGFTVAR